MLTFLVYLWLKLDAVITAVATSCFMYVLFIFIKRVFDGENTRDYSRSYRPETYEKAMKNIEDFQKKLKKRMTIVALILFTCIAIPNSNQVAVLAATHYTQELVQSEEGQKIVQLVRKKAAKYLDEQLKELDEGVANKTQKVVDVVKN